MGLMEDLCLYDTHNATDKGITAFARAIDARGLPKVRELQIKWKLHDKWTALGFGAVAFALVKGCPELEELNLKIPDRGQDRVFWETMLKGMLQAARREVYLNLW